ncbi:MAG: transcriptional regulator GcvA [Caulobacteraceae bacterium]
MAIRPPSLRAIAAFEAAARHQSFSKAADELNLTQGAVSHAIRALEERLGQKLFERDGRGVRLTGDGSVFASRVRLSLTLLSDAFEVGSARKRSRLVISVLPSFAENVLTPRLSRFAENHSDVAVELKCTSSLANLNTGEADLAIRYGPGGWAGLTSQLLASEVLFPVASPDYRGGDLPHAPDDLADCTLIEHPEFNWRLWLEPLGLHSMDYAAGLSTDESSVVIAAAKAGLGVALARSLLAHDALDAGSLVRLFDFAAPAQYGYFAVFNPASPRRQLIETFTAWLKAELAAMINPSPPASGR